MAENPYGAPPPPLGGSGGPGKSPPGGPGVPPGMGGLPGLGPDAPPRPWWETVVLVVGAVSLAPFFFPDSLVPPQVKLATGLTATALLIWVFARRIRALRGKFVPPGEQLQTGGPKPYHIGRRHDPHKH